MKASKLTTRLLAFSTTFLSLTGLLGATLYLNEVRIDGSAASDANEYVEIYSDIPNASLNGLSIIVIGDNPTGSIEEVITFGSGTTMDGQYFLVAQPELQIAVTPDLERSLNFENSDNVTFLLVSGFTGATGDNIDDDTDGGTAGDGVPNATLPWTSIIDGVAIIEEEGNPPSNTEYEYATTFGFETIGPSNTSTRPAPPAHVYRLEDGTGDCEQGTFSANDFETEDTPRTDNAARREFASVTFANVSISESAGTMATTLTVMLEEAYEDDLTIAIQNTDPSELSVQTQAVIPAGTINFDIQVDARDDAWADGTQNVTCRVGAVGFFPETASIDVTDDAGDIGRLVINEVYASGAEDANQDGVGNRSNDEFIEIVNVSEIPIDISGFMIKEFAALSGFTPAQHVFPAGTILPDGCAIVVFGGGIASQGRLPGFGGSFVQNNSSSEAFGLDLTDAGDFVSLENTSGIEEAGVIFQDIDIASYTRNPDRTGDFATSFPSPGYLNDGDTTFCPLPAQLALSMDPLIYTENGATGTLTVEIPSMVGSDVVVTLMSDDESEALINPTMITITAGTTSNTATVSFPDDDFDDGDQTAVLSGAADDYVAGSLEITIQDDGEDGPGGFVQGALVINEVLFDPNAGGGDILDANGDGTPDSSKDEFVELVNASGGSLDISGWTVSDEFSTRHTFEAETVLAEGCAVLIFGGGMPTGSFGGSLVLVSSLGLNNGADTVTIRDSSDNLISAVSWTTGSIGDGFSANLDPDLTGTAFIGHPDLTGSVGRASPGTFADGTVFCTPSGGDYGAWATANNVGEGPDGDDDDDGKSNLLEYSLGCDPQVPDNGDLTNLNVNGSGFYEIDLTKGAEAGSDPMLTYSAQVSTDLKNWNTNDLVITVNDATNFSAEYQGSEPDIFIRMVVTLGAE